MAFVAFVILISLEVGSSMLNVGCSFCRDPFVEEQLLNVEM